MEVFRSEDACPRPAEGSAIAIGVFDGVHLGHTHLVGEARRLGAELGARSAVVTFDRHPASVVRSESAPCLLTDLDQRLELLAATGVDLVYVVTFDDARSKEEAEDFITGTLLARLGARAVVVGADFHFGYQRRGDVGLLSRMGAERGFEVDGIELLASRDASARAVSSTAIRATLSDGDVASAARMLGRHHEVRGTVITGDRRGRELGFPTANVAVSSEICLPADGIYAGWYARPDGEARACAISLGRRPTFYASTPEGSAAAPLLEAYLLDFDGDLYGEAARVRFVARLRGEERFDSVDALVVQMNADVARARTILAGV